MTKVIALRNHAAKERLRAYRAAVQWGYVDGPRSILRRSRALVKRAEGSQTILALGKKNRRGSA